MWGCRGLGGAVSERAWVCCVCGFAAGWADAERQVGGGRGRRVQHVLLGDGGREARAAGGVPGPGADGDRRGADGDVQAAVPSGAADQREGGRGEQLRAGALHDREGDRGPVPGPDPEAGGQLHGAAGVFGFQRGGRGDGVGAGVAAAGAAVGGLREEVEAGVHGVPVAAGVDVGGGAVQQRAVDALAAGAHGRGGAAGQRGDLRHLPAVAGHRAADVHEPEPAGVAGDIVADGVAAVRRGAERGCDGVPDEPGAVPADPLHAVVVRAGDIGGEGVPRAAVGGGDHELGVRAVVDDGEVRPAAREVHGVLSDVPGRRGAEGRECGGGDDQDEANDPVRGLVPDGVQVRDQLPAADGGAGRGPGEGAEGGVHDLEQHVGGGGVFADRPQV